MKEHYTRIAIVVLLLGFNYFLLPILKGNAEDIQRQATSVFEIPRADNYYLGKNCLVAKTEGRFSVHDKETGEERWAKEESIDAVYFIEEYLITTNDFGYVYSYNTLTGDQNWKGEMDHYYINEKFQSIYHIEDGALIRVNSQNGNSLWTFRLPTKDEYVKYSLEVQEGLICLKMERDYLSLFYFINPEDGALIFYSNSNEESIQDVTEREFMKRFLSTTEPTELTHTFPEMRLVVNITAKKHYELYSDELLFLHDGNLLGIIDWGSTIEIGVKGKNIQSRSWTQHYSASIGSYQWDKNIVLLEQVYLSGGYGSVLFNLNDLSQSPYRMTDHESYSKLRGNLLLEDAAGWILNLYNISERKKYALRVYDSGYSINFFDADKESIYVIATLKNSYGTSYGNNRVYKVPMNYMYQ